MGKIWILARCTRAAQNAGLRKRSLKFKRGVKVCFGETVRELLLLNAVDQNAVESTSSGMPTVYYGLSAN